MTKQAKTKLVETRVYRRYQLIVWFLPLLLLGWVYREVQHQHSRDAIQRVLLKAQRNFEIQNQIAEDLGVMQRLVMESTAAWAVVKSTDDPSVRDMTGSIIDSIDASFNETAERLKTSILRWERLTP